jgi:hypothetical protein
MKRVLVGSLLLISFLDAKIVITPTVGKQITTPKASFKDDEVLLGVGIQAYINDNFAVDMRVESSDSNWMADGGRTDIERGSVNLLYDFTPKYRVSPYILGGLGYEKLHRTYKDIKSQPFYQAGVGLKINLTENLEFITEAKYIKKSNTKDSEVVATCGLGVKFGADDKCEISCDSLMQDKKNPVVKPAIEPVKHIKNDDKTQVVFSDEVVASEHLLKSKEKNSVVKKSFSTKSTTVPRGNYIQVGAYSSKSNAIKKLHLLKSKGFKTKSLKRGGVTVVLVGPYSKGSISKVYKKVKAIQKDAFYKKL